MILDIYSESWERVHDIKLGPKHSVKKWTPAAMPCTLSLSCKACEMVDQLPCCITIINTLQPGHTR